MAASKFLDCCRFNPTLGGTTDWIYSSAVTGYQSPTAAGAANGVQYSYRAESADLSQWEVGTGNYNSGTTTFARTAVLFNSLGTTAKVNFSTAPQVAIVSLGEDINVLSSLTASLGADVLLNNSANYFDGPSVAQGASGTWLATGSVTMTNTTAGGQYNVKLWDGTTVIASARGWATTANVAISVALSGVITSPAGNIRISVQDTGDTTGKIVFNNTGNSKDSTITAVRIG